MLILLGQTFWNENRSWYPDNYQLHKNPSLYFKEQCMKIEGEIFTYFYVFFFFNKPNYYISSSVDWIIFATIYLPFNLLNTIWYSTDVEVHPVSLRFSLRTSKILMKLNILFFLKFYRHKMLLLFSYYFSYYFLWNIRTC